MTAYIYSCMNKAEQKNVNPIYIYIYIAFKLAHRHNSVLCLRLSDSKMDILYIYIEHIRLRIQTFIVAYDPYLYRCCLGHALESVHIATVV